MLAGPAVALLIWQAWCTLLPPCLFLTPTRAVRGVCSLPSLRAALGLRGSNHASGQQHKAASCLRLPQGFLAPQGNNHASVRQYQEAIVTAIILKRPALIGSHLHPVLCQYQHRYVCAL